MTERVRVHSFPARVHVPVLNADAHAAFAAVNLHHVGVEDINVFNEETGYFKPLSPERETQALRDAHRQLARSQWVPMIVHVYSDGTVSLENPTEGS